MGLCLGTYGGKGFCLVMIEGVGVVLVQRIVREVHERLFGWGGGVRVSGLRVDQIPVWGLGVVV